MIPTRMMRFFKKKQSIDNKQDNKQNNKQDEKPTPLATLDINIAFSSIAMMVLFIAAALLGIAFYLEYKQSQPSFLLSKPLEQVYNQFQYREMAKETLIADEDTMYVAFQSKQDHPTLYRLDIQGGFHSKIDQAFWDAFFKTNSDGSIASIPILSMVKDEGVVRTDMTNYALTDYFRTIDIVTPDKTNTYQLYANSNSFLEHTDFRIQLDFKPLVRHYAALNVFRRDLPLLLEGKLTIQIYESIDRQPNGTYLIFALFIGLFGIIFLSRLLYLLSRRKK